MQKNIFIAHCNFYFVNKFELESLNALVYECFTDRTTVKIYIFR